MKTQNYNHNLGLGKLGRDISLTLSRQIISIGLGLASSILIARVLGPEEKGQYAIIILLPSLLSTVLNLGISPANVYFISQGKVSVKSAFKTSLILCLLLSVLGITFASLMIVWKGSIFFPGISPVLLGFALVIFPIDLFQSYMISLLQGVQDFNRYNSMGIISPVIYLVLAIVIVWWMKWGVLGALLASIVAGIVSLLISLKILQPYLNIIDDIQESYVVRCLNYGRKAHLSNVAAFINYRADILLINFFLTSSAVGIYSIAVNLIERLWLLPQVVSTVLLPRLSELQTQEDNQGQILTPLIARWVLFITFFAAGILAFFGRFLLEIFFGIAYSSAYFPLLWLIPGIILGSFAKILANDIAARGKPELNMYTAWIVVMVNVIANLVLIPKMGIVGAAIATTLAYSGNAVAKLYLYTRLSKTKWWSSVFLNKDDLEIAKLLINKFFGT